MSETLPLEKALKLRLSAFQRCYTSNSEQRGQKLNPGVQFLLKESFDNFNGVLNLAGNHPALKSNKIDDAQFEVILQSIIDSSRASDESGGKPLDFFPLFKELNVSYHAVTDKGVERLAEFLKECSDLKSINLSFNSFGAAGATFLAKALQLNNTVSELDLSYNQLGYQGAIAVASTLQVNTSIKNLNLRACKLPADALIGLASVLRNNATVESLNISDNATPGHHLSQELHSNVLQHVSEMLRCSKSLRHVNLSSNAINDWIMVDFLASGIASSVSLETLNLSANSISIDGCAELCSKLAASTSRNLKELALTSNSVKNEGAYAIADFLVSENCMLESLKLENNKIGSNGLVALAGAINSSNKSLQKIFLAGNHWDPVSAEEFSKLVGGITKSVGLPSSKAEVYAPRVDARGGVVPPRDLVAEVKRDVQAINELAEKVDSFIQNIDNPQASRLAPHNVDMQFAKINDEFTAHVQRLPTPLSPREAYLKAAVALN